MSRCIGWGPKTTWNGSHIHIQCVLDNSYVVDGQMDPPSFHCHQTCWCRVWGVDQFPGLQWVYKWCQGALVEAPKPQWFPHYSIHMERVVVHLFRADTGQMNPPSCLSYHTCCPRIHGVGRFPGSQQDYKWCQGALVEAPNPHGLVVTPTPII